jgi:hypothetical protein
MEDTLLQTTTTGQGVPILRRARALITTGRIKSKIITTPKRVVAVPLALAGGFTAIRSGAARVQKMNPRASPSRSARLNRSFAEGNANRRQSSSFLSKLNPFKTLYLDDGSIIEPTNKR